VGSPGQLPKRPVPRRFADDAARDTVILSADDIKVAQEALMLAREDREADPSPPAAKAPSPGEPGPARPQPAVAPPPARADDDIPSWGTVLATTVRLWWQRRVRAASPRWRVLTVLVLAAVLLAAAALGVTLSLGGGHPSARASGGAASPGAPGQAAGTAALKAAAAARTAAAAWVVQQVASDAIVACDPQMCAVLQQAGVPAGRLQPLGTGQAGPLSSDVLVATAAVRQEFGARLARVYAPAVLASFGTGSAQVAIRVIAPDGAAAYVTSLRTDQAARVSAGKQLLRNPRIHAAPTALPGLANGQVDARLLTVFAALATLHSVRVLGFAAAPAGASPGLPLRTAYLAPAGPGTRQQPNSLPSLASFLRAQLPPYRPASITEVRLSGGSPALRVEFAAPSPLGLLGKS
jgi:hypothetical protein